jgi:nicotinamide-nucleotide adenylyltransferase
LEGYVKTAAYIGRFQPFHMGHLEYIRRILRGHERLRIIIGSSQEKGTSKNPFTAEERKRMILIALGREGLAGKVSIIQMKDHPSNDIWMDRAQKRLGRIDRVYAGENQLVRDLFMERGYDVHYLRRRIMGISGTKIRSLIAAGKPWKHLVPLPISEYIREIDGEKRIKSACRL